jgi:Protein of unknown function (DUF3822)
MPATGNNIVSGLPNLTDESFIHKEKSGFDAYIFFDADVVYISAWDYDSNTIVAFESFILPDKFTSENPDIIFNSLDSSELMKNTANYRNTVIVSGMRNSTLVPNPLYDNNSIDEQYQFAFDKTSNNYFIDDLQILEAKNVYTLPQTITDHINNKSQHPSMIHASSAVIETQLTTNRNRRDELMTLVVHNSYFEIIVTKGKTLLFYNTFDIENTDSIIYFTLFCCEQLNLNPDTIHLQVGGKIGPTAATYLSIKKYFRHVSFCKIPDNVNLSYLFNDLPEHLLYNIYCIPTCVS